MPYRTLILVAAALGLWACSKAELTDADIVALNAVALRAELAAGRVTALRVTQTYL
jgi:hypothetical protein